MKTTLCKILMNPLKILIIRVDKIADSENALIVVEKNYRFTHWKNSHFP